MPLSTRFLRAAPHGQQPAGRTTNRRWLGACVCALALAAAAGQPAVGAERHPASAPDAVVTWNENAGEAALAACIAPFDNPLHESRLYAMTHVAIHDALNAIHRRSEPYAFDVRARRRTSPDAAVATSARDVLVALLAELPPPFPQACRDAGIASVEADYTAALGGIAQNPAKDRGIAIGRAAAAAILTLRAGDGSDTPLIVSDYPQGTEPGQYRFTPDRPFAFAPGWGNVTPFVLRDSAQFRPEPPYALTRRAYARDFDEVKRFGGDGVTTPSARTDDQTQSAHFWLESSPLAWNRIARTVSVNQRLRLWENARLFGLLNMALADGYVGSFEAKYLYNFWRPVTAIRLGDDDGNRRTAADPTWTPLVTTPPIPDQDSAHAVEGGAASAVFERIFDTDHIGFETCSLTLPEGGCDDASPVFRRYAGFSHAAEENAASRILIGFHFRKAVVDGLEHGRQIGRYAADRLLRPVHRERWEGMH